MKKAVHVAVGVIQRADGAILIAKRPEHAHQGGFWEFPGGKVEQGESVQSALARELHEELDLTVSASRPLIQIAHDYADKSVLLDVWLVTEFSGEPHGKEGQPLRWCLPAELSAKDFPAANGPIILAIQLPDRYWITPEPDLAHMDLFWRRVDQVIESGVKLIQLRSKVYSSDTLKSILLELFARASRHSVRVLVNEFVELAAFCDGVHLTAAQLKSLPSRPLLAEKLVAASCHSPAELALAEFLECDFAVLSPIAHTKSHPEAVPIGWEHFANWVSGVKIPVYGLGGLNKSDLEHAWAAGAQGVAGISGF